MEKLKFIRPTKEYEQQAYDYIEEFKKYNSKINGTGGLDDYIGKYDEWLKKLEIERENYNKDRVPNETFMLIREEDNKLLGIINIRLALNEYLLQHGGHIGYGIRPTERRKGYNSYQLYCALKFCKEKELEEVLLTCHKDNLGSVKTIENSCGILENEVKDKDGKIIQRYWINVDDAIKKYEGSKQRTR